MIDLILHSNLFNFAIFLLIIIVIAVKIDISALLEGMRAAVTEKIDDSQKAKAGGLENLENAKLSAAKTDDEIAEILTNAETTSQAMKSHIISDANEKIHAIAKNSKNIMQSEEKHSGALLVSKLGAKSVELARGYIIDELKQNPDLHNKFINESIEDLERAVL